MGKVLVTGADGFLGSHVVRRALDAGWPVRAFIQPGRSAATLQGLPVEQVWGDLSRPADVAAALQGCTHLIHTAASTAVWPSRSQKQWQINYHAVVGLAEAAARAGITRYVHVGSASSFGYGTLQHPGTEESPYLGARFGLDYLDSKKAAMDHLVEQHRASGLPVVILAPTFLLGEYDTAPGSGRTVIGVCRHQVPGYARGGKCVAYAGDVAQAAVNALTLGREGHSYITGGENLPYGELFRLITSLAGVPPLRWRVPGALTILVGAWFQLATMFTRREPVLSITMARISLEGYYYSSQKAVDELHMPQTGAREAVRRAIAWFRANGYM